MNRDDRHALATAMRGACCGAAATIPMTAAMFLIQRMLPPRAREPQEPQQIVNSLLDRTASGAGTATHPRRLLAATAHFGYGAAAGAVYCGVDQAFQPLPGRGAAYGLTVFALSYAGWLPAFDVLPSPKNRPPERTALLVISHLVWGVSLQHLYSSRKFAGSKPLLRPLMGHQLLQNGTPLAETPLAETPLAEVQ